MSKAKSLDAAVAWEEVPVEKNESKECDPWQAREKEGKNENNNE